MLIPVLAGRFKRDLFLMRKRGKDLGKLKTVMELLAEEKPVPARHRDHPLRGNWNGYRDLHIEPDWLLIYRIVGDELRLARTGTHADIFDE